MKRFIEIRFTFIGIHRWPNAPMGVAYLRYPHRHVFHVRCRQRVSHNDREIEFLIYKERVSSWLVGHFPDTPNGENDLGTLSCEALAEMLMIEFDLEECEVSEDGENGALLQKERNETGSVFADRGNPKSVRPDDESPIDVEFNSRRA